MHLNFHSCTDFLHKQLAWTTRMQINNMSSDFTFIISVLQLSSHGTDRSLFSFPAFPFQLCRRLYYREIIDSDFPEKRDRMPSFTERRSCQISWQRSLPSRATPLSLFQFSEGSFLLWEQQTSTAETLREQYLIHFPKSICIIFKDVFAAIDRLFFPCTHLILGFISAHILLGLLIETLKAFSHFTQIHRRPGGGHTGIYKQAEGQSDSDRWVLQCLL